MSNLSSGVIHQSSDGFLRDLNRLVDWYKQRHRKLPWRKDPTLYNVMLAEYMSQQTVLGTTLNYYHKFKHWFPTLDDLAHSDVSTVVDLWSGLGYYSRARRLHQTCQIVSERRKLDPEYPNNYSDLLSLPGIGPYTAAAIASQVFLEPRTVWDGNVTRVSSRYFGVENPFVDVFRDFVIQQVDGHLKILNPSHVNQGLMELGALVCKPQNPNCSECPMKEGCQALIQSKQHEWPLTKPRAEKTKLQVRSLWIEREGSENEVFLVRRGRSLWFTGLWDFPSDLGGGKTPINEKDIGEILQKEGLHSLEEVSSCKHTITRYSLDVRLYKLSEREVWQRASDQQHEQESQWVPLKVLRENQLEGLSTIARKLLKNFQ